MPGTRPFLSRVDSMVMEDKGEKTRWWAYNHARLAVASTTSIFFKHRVRKRKRRIYYAIVFLLYGKMECLDR